MCDFLLYRSGCTRRSFLSAFHCELSPSGRLPYADLGEPQAQLRAQVAEAQKTNAPNLADLQAQLAEVSQQRETVFKGETLRGLLLTSYGFSEFGTKAAQFATVAYLAAAAMLVLALLGFIHALLTPKTATFAAPESAGTAETPART
jgi:hypothetical protein